MRLCQARPSDLDSLSLPLPSLGAALPTPPPPATPAKPQVLEPSLGPGKPELGRPGLQTVLQSFCGLKGVMASFAAPGLVSGVAKGLGGPRDLHSCTPAWSSPVGPTGRGGSWWPVQTCFLWLYSEQSKALGTWLPSLSDCPLLPFSKRRLQRSSRKCRWKMLTRPTIPSSWRTRPHPSCHHPLLPNPTPSRSRGLPQGPKGQLLCFSWASHSTVPSVHLAEGETEARVGKAAGPRSLSDLVSELGLWPHFLVGQSWTMAPKPWFRTL